jgi:Trm5-related predicted tRNA methylase
VTGRVLKISPTIISKYSYQVNQLERELEQLKQRFRTTQSEVRPYYLSTLVEITNIVTYDLYIDRCKFYFFQIMNKNTVIELCGNH